jgi:hypothetical protein
MANNSYIGDYEYTSPLFGDVLVKSRVYKYVDKQKNVLRYEVLQTTYWDGKKALETGMSGDVEFLDLTKNDIDNALSRKAKKIEELV